MYGLKLHILIERNKVIVEGQVIERPSYIGVAQWLTLWEQVVMRHEEY